MKHRAACESAKERRKFGENGETQTIWTLVVALGFTLLLLFQRPLAPGSASSVEPTAERAPSHAMTGGS